MDSFIAFHLKAKTRIGKSFAFRGPVLSRTDYPVRIIDSNNKFVLGATKIAPPNSFFRTPKWIHHQQQWTLQPYWTWMTIVCETFSSICPSQIWQPSQMFVAASDMSLDCISWLRFRSMDEWKWAYFIGMKQPKRRPSTRIFRNFATSIRCIHLKRSNPPCDSVRNYDHRIIEMLCRCCRGTLNTLKLCHVYSLGPTFVGKDSNFENLETLYLGPLYSIEEDARRVDLDSGHIQFAPAH